MLIVHCILAVLAVGPVALAPGRALSPVAVALDGAVVLMVPVLLALARDSRAPLTPLFLGVIAVANAASIAVPQGNPTSLVLMNQLGLSPMAFLGHMLAPGLAAGVS